MMQITCQTSGRQGHSAASPLVAAPTRCVTADFRRGRADREPGWWLFSVNLAPVLVKVTGSGCLLLTHTVPKLPVFKRTAAQIQALAEVGLHFAPVKRTAYDRVCQRHS